MTARRSAPPGRWRPSDGSIATARRSILSLHEPSDWIVLALSLLQALVLQAWQETKPAQKPPGPAEALTR